VSERGVEILFGVVMAIAVVAIVVFLIIVGIRIGAR